MDTATMSFLAIAALFAMMAIGVPVFVALGVSSAIGILLLQGFDALSALPGVMYDRMASFTLVAVPLFIFAGTGIELIERSGQVDDLAKLL